MGRALELIHRADYLLNAYLPRFGESGQLNTYMFHVMLNDESELARNLIQPQQRTTVEHLKIFLDAALETGVSFVTAKEIAAGLPRVGRYAWLTFDDGYFNNTRALPVLEEYEIPVTLFVSSGNVLENKGYWNDILQRELTARGKSEAEIEKVGFAFHHLTHHEIEEKLTSAFGADALTPKSDLDRPLKPDELKDMAAHRFVEIGNHTRHHAVLKNYSNEEALAEIVGAGDDLENITGERPLSFSYPVGYFDELSIRQVKNAGIKVGVTVDRRRNSLPLSEDRMLTLGRNVIWARSSIREQIASSAGTWSIFRTLRRIMKKDHY